MIYKEGKKNTRAAAFDFGAVLAENASVQSNLKLCSSEAEVRVGRFGFLDLKHLILSSQVKPPGMETKIPNLNIFAIAKSAPVLHSVLRLLHCGTSPAALNLVLVEIYDDFLFCVL